MGKFTEQAIANVPAELRLQVLENTRTALKALAFSEALAAIMVQKGIITKQEQEVVEKAYTELATEEAWDAIEEGIKTLKRQVKINQIVEKIITEGIESLTEEEQKIYEEMDDAEGKDLVNSLFDFSHMLFA